MTDLSKSQLNTILSALDGKQRNPNTKDAALKAITKHGERLGLTADDILAAAGGLLDGRQSPEEFLAMVSTTDAEAQPAEGDEDEPAEDYIMPNAGPLAETPKRREGTKQALMIELLRRPEGATIAQIAAATGWQSHTCRGVIAGALKKKLGLTITTERVRNVGPNKEGARGSYTVYRVAD